MTNEELDVFETVLREGWAIDSPITKIDMEFLASAADAITTLRVQLAEARADADSWKNRAMHQNEVSNREAERADRAEATLAAQIEAAASVVAQTNVPYEWTSEGAMQRRALRFAADVLRAQPHDRTALDAMLRAEREKALREAADLAAHYTDKITAEDIANDILALIPRADRAKVGK